MRPVQNSLYFEILAFTNSRCVQILLAGILGYMTTLFIYKTGPPYFLYPYISPPLIEVPLVEGL